MKRGLILLFFVLVASDLAFGQGCSQCRLLTEQGSELSGDSFGSNINTGILYLIAIPYLLLMFLFRKQIVRLFRKLRKAKV